MERVCRDPELRPPKHSHQPNSENYLPTPAGHAGQNPWGHLGQTEVKPRLGGYCFGGRGEVTRVGVFGVFYIYCPSMQVENVTANQISALLGQQDYIN